MHCLLEKIIVSVREVTLVNAPSKYFFLLLRPSLSYRLIDPLLKSRFDLIIVASIFGYLGDRPVWYLGLSVSYLTT